MAGEKSVKEEFHKKETGYYADGAPDATMLNKAKQLAQSAMLFYKQKREKDRIDE